MTIDITAQVNTALLVDTQNADAGDVKTPIDNLVTVVNNTLNGSQEFEVLRGTLVADPSAHATMWKLYFKSTGLFLRQSTAAGGAVVGPLGSTGAVDSDDVTYTPTTLADWDGAADPGDVEQALDQLAERTTDLEGSSAGTPGQCQGRLTLSSTDPAPSADQTAKTTLYFLPHKGNRLSLYESSVWAQKTIPDAGVSIAIPATTDTNYDVYLYDNAGTLTLDLTAWTDATTRATALVKQHGVWVKTGATSRLYLGTIRTTGVSGQCEDSVDRRLVWNNYNRILRKLLHIETTNTWAYTTAAFRAMNNSAANAIEICYGLSEDMFECNVVGNYTTSSGVASHGIGVDSTTTNSATLNGTGASTAGSHNAAGYEDYPTVGYHKYTALEYGATGVTMRGDNNAPTLMQSGIRGKIWG